MAATKDDLKEMMKTMMSAQREEREKENNIMQEVFKQGIAGIQQEVREKLSGFEEKQNTLINSQASLETRLVGMEEEIRAMKGAAKPGGEGDRNVTGVTESSEPEIILNDTERQTIKKIVKHARRVIGLHPIDQSDIRRIGRMNNTTEEEEIKILAVKEFLKYEMKIPNRTIDEMLTKVSKIWIPVHQEWDRLYVEFQEDIYVRQCYTYARNLKKDIRLITYVPKEFRERNRAIEQHAYQLRHGEDEYKTRVQFGMNDIELRVRKPDQRSWTMVKFELLPPVDINPPPSPVLATSPTAGRSRSASAKRPSPASPSSTEKGAKSSKSDFGDPKQDQTSPKTNPSIPSAALNQSLAGRRARTNSVTSIKVPTSLPSLLAKAKVIPDTGAFTHFQCKSPARKETKSVESAFNFKPLAK